ncbi:MAG: choice-of-anchor E domain-containing protein [Planctomycetes bacterium]|nr:choice-of-anchor E domain-containing protein [Planctomycetota bacterium]
MTRRLLIGIVFVLFATHFLDRVHAQFLQVNHSRTVPLAPTNFATSITVPKFDPALGQLVNVGITARWQAPAQFQVENQDPFPILMTVTYAASLELMRPDASPLLTSNLSANANPPLGAFDGVLDFAGPSGFSLALPNDDVGQTSPPTSPADLALFTGAGAFDTIALPVVAQAAMSHIGGGNITVSQSLRAGVSVDISYTYDPARGIRAFRTNTARAPGRVVENFIVVENTGGLTATDVEVLESVDPRFYRLLDLEPAGVLDAQHLAALGIVAWRIPSLAPGEARVLNYHARLDPNTPLGTNLPGGPLWAGFGLIRQWVDCLDDVMAEAPACGCVVGCGATPCGLGADACLLERANCYLGCVEGDACLRSTRDALVACFASAQGILGRHQDDSPAIGPFDPNEKRVGNRPTVRPTEALVYAVHYENVGTLEAIDVFIRDTLDPNLDPTTVQFLAGPPGTVNLATREITWSLLNVNLQPGATDSVAFSARPVSNLPSGSRVANRARIQFETQPAIETNEVVNTIDSLRPSGRMVPLPETTTTEFVSLSWSGTDTLDGAQAVAGEPLHYSVYVSENDGPFRPFQIDTTDTDGIFVGHAGSHYEFYCVARDAAGNEELQSPNDEASTTLLPANVSIFCSGDGSAAPCPCNNASLAGSLEGCASSLGTGGKLVTSGEASLSQDTLRLLGSRMPNCAALYFQGRTRANNGLGVPFGDGLLCLDGTLSRLMLKQNAGGSSRYPDPADPTLSLRALIAPGEVMFYQCYYRNAAAYCTLATYNTTNAVAVTWLP